MLFIILYDLKYILFYNKVAILTNLTNFIVFNLDFKFASPVFPHSCLITIYVSHHPSSPPLHSPSPVPRSLQEIKKEAKRDGGQASMIKSDLSNGRASPVSDPSNVRPGRKGNRLTLVHSHIHSYIVAIRQL